MSTKPHPLDGYKITYEITALPYVIFGMIVEAKEVLEFKQSFYLPQEVRSLPVECRFCIYGPDGGIVDLASEIVPGSEPTIRAATNIVPLKMLNKLLNKLRE